MHSNRKESMGQVIQKNVQSIILAKSHSIETENVNQFVDDEAATTSGVKDGVQINKQPTKGSNRCIENGVKNSRPWKLRSSNA